MINPSSATLFDALLGIYTRRNEALIQCDSCLRILYFAPAAANAAATPSEQEAGKSAPDRC